LNIILPKKHSGYLNITVLPDTNAFILVERHQSFTPDRDRWLTLVKAIMNLRVP